MSTKRSLLIGCNYPGTSYPLKGCINDITAVSQILRTKFGFTDPLQNRMLADKSCTTDNILERLNWLVDGLVPGDVAFLHYSGHGCFSGDTKIPLLNGEVKTFEELVRDYSDREFWVYSCDSQGNVVAGKASNPRITKRAKVMKIILDNNEEVHCTEDHLFLMRDGSYKPAKNLIPFDSLMPLYKEISSKSNKDRLDGYEKIFNPGNNKWNYTHYIVALNEEIIPGTLYKGVIHHKDFNKLNNDPDNLIHMSRSDHTIIHSHSEERREQNKKNAPRLLEAFLEKMNSDPEFRMRFSETCSKRVRSLWENDDYRESVSNGITRYWNNLTDEEYKLKSERHSRQAKSHWDNMSEEERKTRSEQISKGKRDAWNKLTDEERKRKQESVSKQAKNQPRKDGRFHAVVNHKVLRIENTDDIEIPVYDISVEKYHNFALNSGIFVHNSQVPVTDYDLEEEPDGLDEIICPIDIDWRTKVIKDNDLKSIFSKVPPGVNITVLSDSCHSGGLLREMELPIELQELLKGPNRIKSIPMPIDIENRSAGLDLQPKPRSLQDPQLVAYEDQSGILISGCKSDQTSADAYFQQRRAYHGAATFAFMRVLEKHEYLVGYGDLVHEMNLILADLGYEQRPELNASSTLFDKPFLSAFS